jgi:hypothetical protein
MLFGSTNGEAPIVEGPSLHDAQAFNSIMTTPTRYESSMSSENALNVGSVGNLVCCGLALATLPDLLQHIEERHKHTPPRIPSPSEQAVRQPSMGSPTVGSAANHSLGIKVPRSAEEEGKQRKL